MIRVIYFVSDTKKSAAFYQRAFGARRMRPPQAQDYPEDDWIQVRTGAVELAFHKLKGPPLQGKQQDELFKLVFGVPDVKRKRAALVKQGVEMTGIWPLEGGGSICDGWDPNGVRFQIADTRKKPAKRKAR